MAFKIKTHTVKTSLNEQKKHQKKKNQPQKVSGYCQSIKVLMLFNLFKVHECIFVTLSHTCLAQQNFKIVNSSLNSVLKKVMQKLNQYSYFPVFLIGS